MKKYLLPQREKYFKTNLHTHSVISDGKMTPQEVKDAYKAIGYQILAITDHNVIVDHSHMNEPDFLMLTGIEINFNSPQYRPRFDGQVYHLNLIAKRPDHLWTPNKAIHKYPGAVGYEEKMECECMDMSCNVDAVNAMIAKANEKGFLVMYNHPTWSCQSYPDYAPLKGLWAMELQNGECMLQGNDENNSRVYRELVNLGNKIYPTGTDDMHFQRAVGISWIMLGAEKLEYASAIEALEKGDFYMSCGPEIRELYVEDGILKVKCSEAVSVSIRSFARFARNVSAAPGETLIGAEFDLAVLYEKGEGDETKWINITVTDAAGKYATTRAYYLPEL